MLIISFIVNVGVALAMGVAIGVERQINQHPAGLRTNAWSASARPSSSP